nr:immunoglobulin heavy chain junction region [Macaca mulatta]MOY30797.1 immunoglobulin heavy chain junction region [Macaca mulatta]
CAKAADGGSLYW